MMKMNEDFLSSMQEAMHLLRTAGPLEATAAIQRALRGGDGSAERAVPEPPVDALDANPSARAGATEAFVRPHVARQADVEDRGHFSSLTYVNDAGQRNYKLYVPSGYRGAPLPLIVMLHGCTQDADDFAAGTRMNTFGRIRPAAGAGSSRATSSGSGANLR